MTGQSPTLWPSLWLSLRIAASATALTALVAIPLSYEMARRRFRGKSLIEGLIMLPLVLPPTVVGYAIIVLLGTQSLIGGLAYRAMGYRIIFSFEGAVLAAAVVALPMLYIPAKAAFGSVERELEDIAKLMGANPLEVFWHVSIPLARRGLLAGFILAFARALGEFGATVMVFGMQEDRLTLPISIYKDSADGNLSQAMPGVIALALVSLSLILAYNYSATGRRDR